MKWHWLALICVIPATFFPVACATATRTFDGDSGGSDNTGGGSGTSGVGASSGILSGSSGNAGGSPVGDICGDGKLGSTETCDPPGSCPTVCDDADICTLDALLGSPQACNVVCMHSPIVACVADGCCPMGCEGAGDPDCVVCGNGLVESGEECDDANTDNTDACLDTCVSATCGDGFIWAGTETCDDGNAVGGDGCSASCAIEGLSYGPVHTFEGKSSTFFMTQFGCSNSNGNAAADALYFCQHFYNANCVAEPGYTEVMNSVNPMMHSGTNCYSPDPTGISIANTSCVGGPCKIGDYSGTFGGLSNLVCTCN